MNQSEAILFNHIRKGSYPMWQVARSYHPLSKSKIDIIFIYPEIDQGLHEVEYFFYTILVLGGSQFPGTPLGWGFCVSAR